MTDYGLPYTGGPTEGPTTENGWLVFAGLMILFSGLVNLFQGLTGSFHSHFFTGNTVGGPLWVWSVLWIVFGVLQMAASGAIMSHRSWGRWFGIVTVGLAAFLNLLTTGSYPWWSVVILGVEVLVLFALTVKWRKARTPAA